MRSPFSHHVRWSCLYPSCGCHFPFTPRHYPVNFDPSFPPPLSLLPSLEVGSLVALATLNLSNNQIVGLPRTISALTDLTDLDLAGNRIQEIPRELGSLTLLSHLTLDDNRLKDAHATAFAGAA